MINVGKYVGKIEVNQLTLFLRLLLRVLLSDRFSPLLLLRLRRLRLCLCLRRLGMGPVAALSTWRVNEGGQYVGLGVLWESG